MSLPGGGERGKAVLQLGCLNLASEGLSAMRRLMSMRRLTQGLFAPLFLTLLLCASGLGQDFPARPARLMEAAGGTAAGASLTLAGSLAQIASAGGWDTSLTLVNLGTAAGEARLNFYANDGSTPQWPFTFPPL